MVQKYILAGIAAIGIGTVAGFATNKDIPGAAVGGAAAIASTAVGIASVERNNQTMRSRLEQRTSELESQLNNAQAAANQIDQQSSRDSEQVAELTAQLQDVRAEAEQIQAQFQDARAEAEQAEAQMIQLREELESLQAQQANAQELAGEHQDLQGELSAKKEELAALQTSEAELQQTLAERQSELDRLHAEVGTLEAKQSELQQEIDELDRSKIDLEASIQDLNQQRQALDEQLTASVNTESSDAESSISGEAPAVAEFISESEGSFEPETSFLPMVVEELTEENSNGSVPSAFELNEALSVTEESPAMDAEPDVALDEATSFESEAEFDESTATSFEPETTMEELTASSFEPEDEMGESAELSAEQEADEDLSLSDLLSSDPVADDISFDVGNVEFDASPEAAPEDDASALNELLDAIEEDSSESAPESEESDDIDAFFSSVDRAPVSDLTQDESNLADLFGSDSPESDLAESDADAVSEEAVAFVGDDDIDAPAGAEDFDLAELLSGSDCEN